MSITLSKGGKNKFCIQSWQKYDEDQLLGLMLKKKKIQKTVENNTFILVSRILICFNETNSGSG